MIPSFINCSLEPHVSWQVRPRSQGHLYSNTRHMEIESINSVKPSKHLHYLNHSDKIRKRTKKASEGRPQPQPPSWQEPPWSKEHLSFWHLHSQYRNGTFIETRLAKRLPEEEKLCLNHSKLSSWTLKRSDENDQFSFFYNWLESSALIFKTTPKPFQWNTFG